MADTPAPKASKFSGTIKGIIGTATGLLTGAIVMYLSPVLDKVVRPSKPVANFQVQKEGFTVTLANRSANASDGWWDFGDGSALEPVTEDQASIRHTYPGPGSYTVKLTVKNVLGEESERAVPIVLDSPVAAAPAILNLEAIPLSPVPYAPATFRVAGQASNTELCVWDYGDQQPLEITPDGQDRQEKMVTFSKPGNYTIRLAAFNGSQVVERRTTVRVAEAPQQMVAAVLKVSEQATRVQRTEAEITLTINDKGGPQPFTRKITPDKPGDIVQAQIMFAGKAGKNLNLVVAPDKRSAQLSGQFVKDKNQPAASFPVRVKLTLEQRSAVSRPEVPVTLPLVVPGDNDLPLPAVPASWENVQRTYQLQILEGSRLTLPAVAVPQTGALVTLQNRRYKLNAIVLNNKVRLSLTETIP